MYEVFLPPVSVEALDAYSFNFDQIIMTLAKKYHDNGFYGQGITVAYIDTGIVPHPDFENRILPGAIFNFYTDKMGDGVGHGTGVAGLIAGKSSGIAPKAKLLPVRLWDDQMHSGNVFDAVRWVARWRDPGTGKPVDILNMSLTSVGKEDWEEVIKECEQAGITVVCSAGNYGNDGLDRYPACMNYPVVVGAIDRNYKVTDFSSRISEIDVCQLGKAVWTCSLNGSYIGYSGTSFSSPIVAGMLALYKCEDPTRTDAQLFSCLMNGVRDLGVQGHDNQYGYGVAEMTNPHSAKPDDVKVYSLSKDGNTQLSTNFKVKEFAYSGMDKILISSKLIEVLQNIRTYFGKALYILEGYNPNISKESDETHSIGSGADIRISGVNPVRIAAYAQSLGVAGIELYSYKTSDGGFVHVDVRKEGQWRGLKTISSGELTLLSGYFPTLKRGDRGNAVVLLQRLLNCGLVDDGIFGAKTEAGVKLLQGKLHLVESGIADNTVWNYHIAP